MSAETVSTDIDLPTVFQQQVAVAAGVNAIAAEDYAVTADQVNIVFLAADDVTTNGPQPRWPIVTAHFADKNIRSSRRGCCLDRVGGDRDLVHAGFFSTGVDVYFGGWLGIGAVGAMVVVFNIVAGDLQVANFTLLNPNATQPVVTDMIAGDVDLVQANLIQKNSHPRIVVEMAVADKDIAISLKQSNTIPYLVNQHALENRLHGLDQLDPVRFRMRSLDFNVLDRGKPLGGPDFRFHRTGISRSPV